MSVQSFQKLLEVVETLHGPKGCPWDKKQKVSNLKNYILEEVYELCDAIEAGDADLVKEEVGDLFLLLVTLSHLFKQKKRFTAEDALKAITTKLIIRHPHVFSDKKLKTSRAVLAMWVKAKSKKKKRRSIYDRIPKSSPALFSSYLFSKELRHLQKGVLGDQKAKLLKSLAKYKRSGHNQELTDIIFYAACILSSGTRNPESLVRKKVIRESSRVLYGKDAPRKKK
ncbi:MazG nucleotide pyrophosphohydrolase domain-containing protein [Candidatus Omnitrophota bacterium]